MVEDVHLRCAWARSAAPRALGWQGPGLALGWPSSQIRRVGSFERIACGIRCLPLRTPTLPPATHTNVYVVGEKEVWLVDPAVASPEEKERLEKTIASANLRVLGIWLTHHHRDHAIGLGGLIEGWGVKVWAHGETLKRLSIPTHAALCASSDALIEDDCGHRWRVLHTPGHAPGHLAFVRDDGNAIAGDLVAGVGTILIDPQEGDMAAYLDSLRLLGTCAERLLPAHGPVLEKGPEVIERYIAHRLRREVKIESALRAKRQAKAQELLPLAYDDTPEALWPLALRSLESHLIKLMRDGKVIKEGDTYAISQ
ncbi:MAG: MBL fold metallo-hydrolase [Sandaracinaceae bacterium]|nr:MBL fold metallo-hydrolase [Sandaracinaceae bacterium]MDW8246428.1 MBL fold metallo-hydrolase [Sandaracinaceae bacterium]